LKPAVWKEAKRGMVPFVFAGDYNGPGKWRYRLGFVDSGGFIGAEGRDGESCVTRTTL
jgi:D-alanyl-D-alanine carboxypeptidase